MVALVSLGPVNYINFGTTFITFIWYSVLVLLWGIIISLYYPECF